MASHLSTCLDIASLNSKIRPYFVAKRQKQYPFCQTAHIICSGRWFQPWELIWLLTLLSTNIKYCFILYQDFLFCMLKKHKTYNHDNGVLGIGRQQIHEKRWHTFEGKYFYWGFLSFAMNREKFCKEHISSFKKSLFLNPPHSNKELILLWPYNWDLLKKNLVFVS